MDKKNVKILYMGTPSISAYVLERLINDGFNIVGVVSQPDRPVGRKHILEPTPTKSIANKYNIPCYQVEKIRLDFDFIKEINPDLILTLAFGQILPQELIDIPKLGCLNLHGSLLPKYRGAAPIQYALINNEKVTGMTLMEMTKKMDAGKIYATKEVNIEENDNSTSLFNKMALAAYELASTYLPKYFNNELVGIEQDESLVTFAPTIKPEEEHLDLSKPSITIIGYIKALSDHPGAYLNSNFGKIKIYKASMHSNKIIGKVGELVSIDKNGVLLQCIDGTIKLEILQKEGKNRMDGASFANGNMTLVHQVLF